MLVEGLSLITSISNAVGALLISKGMRDSNASSACLISTSVQAVALLIPMMFSIPELNWQALALFALSGALALGIARLLYFIAMEQIGVAVSSAIIGSNPLVSTVLAIVFLSEAVDTATIVGAVLVVGGVFLLSGAGENSVKARSLFIPFLSAFAYSLANVIRKAGLNVQSEPLLGAVAGAVAGVLCFSIYLVVAGKLGEIKATKRSLWYFTACGLVSAVGWFSVDGHADGDGGCGDHYSILISPVQPDPHLAVPQGRGEDHPPDSGWMHRHRRGCSNRVGFLT